MERSTFYFDLGSPYAYLAAERVNAVFTEAGAEVPEWQPVLLGGLFARFDRDSWANGPDRDEGLREVERRASSYGLPPIAWPDPFPGNTLYAMRVATFAKEIGRTVSFSLAAFRQAFAAGRDLTRARQRDARGRGLRDAPTRDRRRSGARRDQGRTAKRDRPRRRARRDRACPRSSSMERSSGGTTAWRRPRRRRPR